MSLTTLEIKPNRLLLDSNFDGYKLSLEEINLSRKNLETPVDKIFLNSSQYGLLHAKLFGLHNHLFVDPYDSFAAVYFADKEFNIQKSYVDTQTNELINPTTVYTIPKLRDHKAGDYNITLHFANGQYAIASDGMGSLYIVATRDKKDDDSFETLFSGKVLDNEEQGFIIIDALYNDEYKELHVLLLHIQEDAVDRFVSIIHWLTLKEIEDQQHNSKTWGQVALRQLKTNGEVQYLHLEKNCEHIYVVSDNKLEFLVNSEHPVQKSNTDTSEEIKKIYKWAQNLEEITIKFSMPDNAQKELVRVSTEPTKIEIAYNSEILLSGDLGGRIDSSLTTWALDNSHTVEITLTKSETMEMWPELIIGDEKGEYQVDLRTVEQVNERLQSFTGETEVILLNNYK